MNEAIKRLKSVTDQDNTMLIMVLLPELHVVGAEYGFAGIYEKVERTARNAGIKHVVNLADNFKGLNPETLWVSPDDAHPNKKAHMIIADGIMDYLKHIHPFKKY